MRACDQAEEAAAEAAGIDTRLEDARYPLSGRLPGDRRFYAVVLLVVTRIGIRLLVSDRR